MTDLTPVTLRDPSSALSAVYVPGAGMIATSLSDGGIELLGQRRGLDAYVSAGKTMGIPLLYPWANRLSAKTYDVDGETVTLAPDAYGVRPDNNGLPIHGLLAAYPGWRTRQVSDQKLTAELDFGAQHELLASFPFPHLVELTVELSDRTLTVSTTVTPTPTGGAAGVRISPVPTAARRAASPVAGRDADDAAPDPRRHRHSDRGDGRKAGDHGAVGRQGVRRRLRSGRRRAVFAVSGGGRRLEVQFEQGYPAAQMFAPAGETSSASSRWPRRPTHCAAAATAPRGRASRTPAVLDQGELAVALCARLPDHDGRALRHDRDVAALPGAQLLELVGQLGEPA